MKLPLPPTTGTRRQTRQRRRGMLTFEWIMLVTIMVIGIIGAMGLVRNSLIGKLSDLAEVIDTIRPFDHHGHPHDPPGPPHDPPGPPHHPPGPPHDPPGPPF